MLPKKNRVDKKIIKGLFSGKTCFIVSPSFNFKYIKSPTHRFSFIVAKSLDKTAVGRNSLKRIGFKSVEKYIPNLPFPVTGVFVFKKKKIENIDNEIKEILSKIN